MKQNKIPTPADVERLMKLVDNNRYFNPAMRNFNPNSEAARISREMEIMERLAGED